MARGGSWIADAVVEDVRCPRVAVRYSPAYRDALAADGSSRLDEMFTLMQEGLFYELGIAFPRIAWETNATLEDRAFQVRINDLEMPPVRGLSLGQSLCNDTAEHLTQRDVEATDIVNPANGNASAVIDDADVAACEARGLTVWDPFDYVILYLSSQLRRFAASYLTVGIVAHDLRELRSAFPDLVDTVVSRHDAATLTRILGCLLEEELSIRDLPSILDGLLMVNGTIRTDLSDFIVMPAEGSHLVDSGVHKRRADELEPYDYSAFIRSTVFKRYISHKYTRGASALAVYTVDQDIERRLRDVEPEALQAGARRAILDAIVTEVSRLAPTARRPALLTTTTVRRRLRRLVEVELPYLPVLCYQELSPELNIEPIARISI